MFRSPRDRQSGSLGAAVARNEFPVYERLGLETAGGEPPAAGAPDADAEVIASITVARSAEGRDRLWRAPDTLTRIMGDFVDVTPAGDGRLHGGAPTPFGRTLEWDSQVAADEPGQRLRWESLPGSAQPHVCCGSC